MTGPRPVQIQPRNKPPKPEEANAHYANANMQALMSTAGDGPPPQPPPEIGTDGIFPDPDPTLFLASPHATNDPEVPEADTEPSSGAQGSILPTGHHPVSDADRPPSTRAEFSNQQKALQGPYPEVIDLFMGRTGEMPATGLLKIAKPVPPPPVVRTEVIIKHDLPTKQAAYKFVRETTVCLDGTMIIFRQNQIVYDVNLIDQLLRSGCDSIAPCEVAETFIQCPACRHQFPPSVGQGK